MQCDALQQQLSQVSQSLDNAHQNCLNAHQSEPADPRATTSPADPICSHAACQSLHNARMELAGRTAERLQACRAEVALFLNNQSLQAAPDAAPPQANQMQQADQARLTAAQQAADIVSEHANDLRRTVALQGGPYVPSTATLALGGEFTSDSPFTSPPAQDVLANVAENRIRIGNPPDSMSDAWQAGHLSSSANGSYEQYVYVWQFAAPDADLCPGGSGGGTARQALYQETAIDQYTVTSGRVTTSTLQKNRVFLRCLEPGMTSGYPKYEVFPHFYTPRGSAVGVRD
jgi:hypothetical protein